MMRHAKSAVVSACLTLAVALAMVIARAPQVAHAEDPLPQAVTHLHWNFYEGPVTTDGDGTPGESVYKNPSSPICSSQTSNDANVNTDCEGTAPHNETTIAVNPTNPLNMIGGANDYQLRLSSGGGINETAYERAHVTFDGGHTWATYPIVFNGYTAAGDPAVAFDADGTAYYSALAFGWAQGNGVGGQAPDILVAHSTDGGKTWSTPVRVAKGTGGFVSPGIFNDKETVAAWGNGNAVVTWTRFNDGQFGSYINSPIYASVTHDGGNTWSDPTQISGSAAFCIGAQGGNACDQSQGSVPVVAADDNIYVAFLNTANLTTGRDQYLVVKLDPATGQRIAGPFRASSVFDGFTDYPISIDGRQTYQDSEFRTWAFGNIAADPTNAAHLAVIWSDMRNSTLPAPSDPYAATTNSDIIVSQSFNGGQTWSVPISLPGAGDQFMPWGAYDASGQLRIGYFDRSYDPANHRYGYTLATETIAGSLSFGMLQVTTALSDPTQGNRWFAGRTPNANFPHPTTFLGDYSWVTASGNSVAAFWTDLRVPTTFGTRTGAGEDTFFAAK